MGRAKAGSCSRGASGRAGRPVGPPFQYRWWWKSKLRERRGQRCRVLARGKMNSVLVEFDDGFRVVTGRYAIRKVISP